MKQEHIVMWHKLIVANEDEKNNDEEDDDYKIYRDEEEQEPNVLTQILHSQQNPFVQLKTYNFWTLDANFILTTWFVIAVANMPGVESADVVSPYRMHISIGRAFDEAEVKFSVQNKLLELVNNEEIRSKS